MKIATISQVYPPMVSGAAISIKQIAEAMSDRGHHMLVLTASDRPEPYIEEKRRVRVVRMQSATNPLRVGQRFSYLTTSTLKSELAVFGSDVVHIHEPFGMGINGLLIARQLGIPTVYTFHQLPWFVSAYLPDLPALRWFLEAGLWSYGRWFIEQFDYTVAPTQSILEEINRHVGRRVLVIGYGVDRNVFAPKNKYPYERADIYQKYGIDPRRPVLLHVGRLDADKKVHAVVEASAKVIRKLDAQLVIVGDGRQRQALEALVDKEGIANRTVFTGFVEGGGDLPGLYRIGDLFITASEIETQGIVLVEAMASGLPIVAVKATCIPEVVWHGVNGYLVSSGDSALMARRMIDILSNQGLRMRFGKNGRDMSAAFAMNTAFDQYEILYKRCAERSRVGEL